MNEQTLGQALKLELEKGHDIERISRWAFNIYSENVRDLNPYLTNVLETLFSMADDPQFELSEDDLLKLCKELISKGDDRNLALPIEEICEVAMQINLNWLMCPICYEAWETISKRGMVRCPKCNKLLHNLGCSSEMRFLKSKESILDLMELLEQILKNTQRRPELIRKFQSQVWEIEELNPLMDHLNILAYDLDYYEPNQTLQKQDESYYGDRELEVEIKNALKKLKNCLI